MPSQLSALDQARSALIEFLLMRKLNGLPTEVSLVVTLALMVILPAGAKWVHALDYSGLRYATPRPTDTPAVAQWRQRMATDDAKGVYIQPQVTLQLNKWADNAIDHELEPWTDEGSSRGLRLYCWILECEIVL